MNKNYLSVRQYADKLGVSAQYIYKLIKEGKVKVVKVGGFMVIPVKESDDTTA